MYDGLRVLVLAISMIQFELESLLSYDGIFTALSKKGIPTYAFASKR